MGEETLAAWLKGPAAVEVARRRQEAVRDSGPRLDLREDMGRARHGHPGRGEPGVARVLGRGPGRAAPARDPIRPRRRARAGLPVLGVSVTASLLAWLTGRASGLPFVAATLLAVGFVIRLEGDCRPGARQRRAQRPASSVSSPRCSGRLEREQFETPLLAAPTRVAERDRRPPRARPAAVAPNRPPGAPGRLARGAPQPYGRPSRWRRCSGPRSSALAVEGWRRAFGPAIGGWLATVGEIEALSSLATYAYEHPELPFPTIPGRR